MSARSPAIEAHLRAVALHLEVFHHVDRPDAVALAGTLRKWPAEVILHEEPYLAAFEIIHPGKPLSTQKYLADRAKSAELTDSARSVLKKTKTSLKFKSNFHLGEVMNPPPKGIPNTGHLKSISSVEDQGNALSYNKKFGMDPSKIKDPNIDFVATALGYHKEELLNVNSAAQKMQKSLKPLKIGYGKTPKQTKSFK